MKNLTKRELTLRVTEQTGLMQQQVNDVIQKTLDCIIETLRTGQTIELRRFGVFEVCERKPRVGRNPHQPDMVIHIPGGKMVRFRPSQVMRKLFR